MPDEQRPQRPIPLLIWALIGFFLVLGFMFALRALYPPSAGITPPLPEVAVPADPKPALPDVGEHLK